MATLNEALAQFVSENHVAPRGKEVKNRKAGCKITLNNNGSNNKQTFRYMFYDLDVSKYGKFDYIMIGYNKDQTRIDFIFATEKGKDELQKYGRYHKLLKNKKSCYTTEVPRKGEKIIRKCINKEFEMFPHQGHVTDEYAWYHINLTKELPDNG